MYTGKVMLYVFELIMRVFIALVCVGFALDAFVFALCVGA